MTTSSLTGSSYEEKMLLSVIVLSMNVITTHRDDFDRRVLNLLIIVGCTLQYVAHGMHLKIKSIHGILFHCKENEYDGYELIRSFLFYA